MLSALSAADKKLFHDLVAFGSSAIFIPDKTNEAHGKEVVVKEYIPLKIMIVGKDAEKLFKSGYVKELIEDGHVVTVDNTEADLVIGTTAVRTYENTIHYLKTIVKKIIADKTQPKSAEPKATKKKADKKKKADEIVDVCTQAEEAALLSAGKATIISSGTVLGEKVEGEPDAAPQDT